MNSCQFNGNKDSYEELNGYIQLFSKKGLIDEKSDSITNSNQENSQENTTDIQINEADDLPF